MTVRPESRNRVLVIAAVTAITLGIHYGWLVEPLFGHVHWLHAVHGRFCYIPIVMAAAWFGLRGGIYTATAISILVLPLIFSAVADSHDIATEVAEIVFYYMFGGLVGGLVDREESARRKQRLAQEQMEQSQKLSLAGQIAAGVAHEIKNPLASIKGAADILGDDDTSQEERKEFKGILQREVQRIDSTVTEFLAFARPRETRREKMDLSESVRRTARQVEGQAASSGVRVVVDAAEGASIEGDTEKIQQLTLNLVLNAVQASQPGDAVRVRTLADGTTVRLLVEDDGPGIAPGVVDRIFEPFYTSRPTGSGLGLAVARAIVDAHHGTITVRSAPGSGSTFEVRLPLAGGGAA